MGYYSEVCLAFSQKAASEFKKAMREDNVSEETREDIQYLLEHAEKHYQDNAGAECWYWHWRTWYNDSPEYFPGVAFIESFMKELPNDDFCFIRVGEDYEDVEVCGWWWDNPFGVSLTREIVLAYK